MRESTFRCQTSPVTLSVTWLPLLLTV